MHVGALKVRVRLYACTGLKAKRSEVKRILARIKARFPVAMAEVGELDKWQVAELGFTCVSNDPTVCERILNQVEDEIEAKADAEVLGGEREISKF